MIQSMREALYNPQGAGSGIGRSVSCRMADLGASVVAVDLNKRNLAETFTELPTVADGQRHIQMHCDVSDAGLIRQLCDYVRSVYERPACTLVNNAGWWVDFVGFGVTMDAQLHNMTEEQFDWVHAVNLRGPFLMTQIFTAAMLESPEHLKSGGSVTNVASIVAKTGNFGQANYAAAKSGLLGLTKTCAIELGARNIRVNAVLPGFIDTPMTRKVPDKVLQGVKGMVPMRRFGQPDEVANVVAFLASNLASYVNGACVEVTGGLGM